MNLISLTVVVASAAKAGAAENKRAVIKEIAFMTSKIPPAAQFAVSLLCELRNSDTGL